MFILQVREDLEHDPGGEKMQIKITGGQQKEPGMSTQRWEGPGCVVMISVSE